MEPEYRLDALLSQRERWNGSRRAASGGTTDDELAPLVAAADRLAVLRGANPAPAFARTLEAQLRSRADHLRAVGAVGAAVERPPTGQQSTALPPALRRLRPVLAAHPIQRVPRVVWPALAAAAMLALVVGTYTAAANAGPDSPLYVVKRAEQSVQVQIARNDAARVQLHLQAADEALNQADAAARSHDNGTYGTALATLRYEASAASQTLATVPAGSDYDALAAQVSDLQTRMRQDLAADLSFINWQNRVNTTTALGGLGVAAPHVSAVTIIRAGGDGHGGSTGDGSGDGHGLQPPADQVTVSGSGFRPGATLVVDGHAAGKVVAITVTPTQIVALVQDENIEHAQHIGVSNPDGTAAETTKNNIHVQDAQGDGGTGDDKHPGATPTATKTATPTATPTATSGDHGGGGGG